MAAYTGRYRYYEAVPLLETPGTSAPGVGKRPGCGTSCPPGTAAGHGSCGDECACCYHNDARVAAPAAVPADSPTPAAWRWRRARPLG